MSAWSHGEAQSWADAMSYALVQHYGRWTVGWRWSHDEGDFDGGPVGNWCCPRDSITTPEETLARVEAALREWREWLEYLVGWFEAYPLDLSDIESQRILWERSARNLILQVVDRTGCGSGWHGHCRQVLTWFLDHWGVAPEVARGLVDEAIGGRFHSWTGPDTVTVDGVAEQLALSLQPADGRGRADAPARDHLQRWLAVRESVPWHEIPDSGADGPVAPLRDGAMEDIRAFDGAIAPARAQGLLSALELLRADAARGARLDFTLLSGWQQHVLDTPGPPRFRNAPAFAKRGRERYGIGPDTRAHFDACLAGSASDAGRPLGLTAPRRPRLSRRLLLPPLRRRQRPIRVPHPRLRPRPRGRRPRRSRPPAPHQLRGRRPPGPAGPRPLHQHPSCRDPAPHRRLDRLGSEVSASAAPRRRTRRPE
ncbi:cell filamentation protein Fic [Streptomyces anulatus]|uniref:cell filamentation protein Fic n=1 Tax=Streptomyces anulatus TaxID=1892 RepID=UPI002DDB3A7C|nr:cell filamentation protein Fic [Streptomyces anulatus]WSC60343.1 cell filamentation protein Fic [Streptomyces anulatus]